MKILILGTTGYFGNSIVNRKRPLNGRNSRSSIQKHSLVNSFIKILYATREEMYPVFVIINRYWLSGGS
ncbi:MAG: hypothetical protein IPF70_04520 [Saprospiraceae bacterium]|nr:hypothetical protein [Saprospiraceae bacterium]